MKIRTKLICFCLCAAFVCTLTLGFSAGCFGSRNTKNDTAVRYSTLSDIPGLTSDDIREVRELLATRESFTYGMMLSTEAFVDSKGEIRGYSALVCDWLSELFGVPFILEHFTWSDLLAGLENGSVDFTGTMTPTEERRKTYFMSDAIAQRSIKYFRLVNSEPLDEITQTRLPRYALLQGSISAGNVVRYATAEFEPVFVAEYSEAYELLKSGEVDALLAESSAEAIFDAAHSDTIVTSIFYPLLYTPVAFTTQNPELEVIVRVVQAALENSATFFLRDLYQDGHHEYLSHKLFLTLTPDERAYIAANPTIYFGAEYDNYPASYFNSRQKEWRGICFDVLDEITALTGLEFVPINDAQIDWPELLRMLTDGEIPFVSELIRSPEREGLYLWTDYPYLSDSSVLISKVEHRNISMNNVHTVKVGLSRGTAHTEFFFSIFPNHENTTMYESQDAALKALANGEIDMMMSNYSTLLHLTNYLELPDYKANIIFDNSFDSGFGFNTDEVLLQGIFNKTLGLIDTRIISEQWTHRRYDYLLSLAQAQRPWLIGVSALSLCVLVLVAALLVRSYHTSRRLGTLVDERTHALALQTATLTAVFDTIPNHIFTKDLNSVYMNCNKSLAEHFGLVKEDLIGKDDVDGLKIDADLAAKFIEEDNKAISDGKTVVKVEVVPHVNGATPLYEITKMPLIVDGETVGIIGVSHDITERVHQEQHAKELIEYAKKLSTALARITQSQSISAGDLKTSADIIAQHGCVALSASNIGVWFLSQDKTYLKNISYYCGASVEFTVLEDFDLKCRGEYAALFRTERLIVMNNSSDCRLINYDTGAENMSCLCAALDAPIRIDGNVVGVVCVEQNECKAYSGKREWTIEEQNFASSLADLMALAISGFERRKAQNEAEIANKSKSTFLASMSHEIRTPMNAILGITEILLQNENLSSETEDGLDKIYNSCNMLLGIINDILDFSKIEAGKLDIIPVKYSVASLINDSVQLNLMRLESKPIEFEVDVDENIPAALIGDELRIKQILNNLLSNAFKYTESGRVSLKITCEITGDDRLAMLAITVRDTGRGMTQTQVDLLFTEYVRFDEETNSKIEGTGLGLAITQRLINLMDGTISAQSEVGVGTEFTVKLMQGVTENGEVLGKEVAENLRLFRTNYMSGKKRNRIAREPMPYGKILVVDDVETNLYVAIGLMRPYKLKVDTASSGQEAIDKVKAKLAQGDKYDIVFMDHMMPEMDGIETTAHLRQMNYDEPIVALTANAVAGQADVFLKNGFNEFISKPIDTRQLNAVLNKLVRDKQPAQVIKAARLQAQANGDETPEEPNTQLLESFIRDGRKTVTALEELVERSDFGADSVQKFIVFVHGIKNALWNIGEQDLAEAAAALEHGGREMSVELLKATAPAFLNALRDLVAKLEAESESAQNTNANTITREKLLALKEACEDYDRKGALSLLSEMPGNSDLVGKLADKLKELIGHSEFEEAVAEIERRLE